MEKPPKFIKEFSKEKAGEERKELVEEIKAKRAEFFEEKVEREKEKEKIGEDAIERERTLEKQIEDIENLKNELERLSDSLPKKLWNYFKLKKIEANLVLGKKSYEELEKDLEEAKKEKEKVEIELVEKGKYPQYEEVVDKINQFYKDQERKWAESEYTKEDIEKYFSEEHLVKLSLPEYITLLKRFPSEMVTHVTRQGIRDHTGHAFHTSGAGEYSEGFMRIIEDGRLRSALGIHLVEGAKEEKIMEFLKKRIVWEDIKTKKELVEKVEQFIDGLTTPEIKGESGSYADVMAIHFAAEEVADHYYGSERGNEMFLTFPSAYISSQYYFSGTLEAGGGYWNDQWVWANEERGMDINSGLVFIPEETKVDKETGSRYEIDENKNPIVNQEYKDLIRKVVDSPDFYNFANQVMEITGKFYKEEQIGPFRRQLEKEFGISDPRLQKILLDYNDLFELKIQQEMRDEEVKDSIHSIDSKIESALKKEGILYTESKNTVSAKEFWESYFTKHSEKKPSKIVYYKGENPTEALNKWREENGLIKKAKEELLGFAERRVGRVSEEANVGLDRFRSILEKTANKLIEEKFPSQKEKALAA